MSPDRKESPPIDAAFEFVAYWVDSVVFETLPEAPKAPEEQRPAKPIYTVRVNVAASIDEAERRSQMTLTWKLTGDLKWQPYKVDVVVTGRFTGPNASPEAFRDFCAINVPAILFPYVREIVHRVTSDGKYGRIRLNPINITQILPKDWSPLPNDSSEPPPPSSQLPDASQD